jgi:hypothetical protein
LGLCNILGIPVVEAGIVAQKQIGKRYLKSVAYTLEIGSGAQLFMWMKHA